MDIDAHEKIYFFELRRCEGKIKQSFIGKDFFPDNPEDEWTKFIFLSKNKNECIDEIIETLKFLKDKS